MGADDACKLASITAYQEDDQGTTGTTVLLGRWGPPALAAGDTVNITFALSPAASAIDVDVQRLPGCIGLAMPCPAIDAPAFEPKRHIAAGAPKDLRLVLREGEAVRLAVRPAATPGMPLN